MCKHKYKLPAFKNKQCPFTDLFAENQDTLGLPMQHDMHGECVFHSSNSEWKKDIFWKYFKALLDFTIRKNEAGEQQHLFAIEFEFFGKKEDWNIFKNVDLSLMLDFRGAIFHSGIHLKESKFTFVNLADATIKKYSNFKDCTFDNLYGMSGEFSQLVITKNKFTGTVLFSDARIYDYCEFSENVFHGYLSFKNTIFRSASEGHKFLFSGNDNNSIVDFTNADFGMDVMFEDTAFKGEVNFIDTQFRENKEIDFFHLKINSQFNIKASDNKPKIFNESVAFKVLEDDIFGSINFKNVNYLNIFPNHRATLNSMVKQGKVNIGKGCIKYRLQTPIKSVKISEDNQLLLSELANTFSQFIKYDEGINLGFEIESQTAEEIFFFYYSDMDVSYEEFIQRIYKSELNMWHLLKVGKDSVDIENISDENTPVKRIRKRDAMIAMAAFILKLTPRIMTGQITEGEFNGLTQKTLNSPVPPDVIRHLKGGNIYQINIGWKNTQTAKQIQK